MHWLDILILFIPLAAVFFLAFHSRRYVRGVADFLAAGRVAGRYVIAVGDMSAALSIITVISLVESHYQSGASLRSHSQFQYQKQGLPPRHRSPRSRRLHCRMSIQRFSGLPWRRAFFGTHHCRVGGGRRDHHFGPAREKYPDRHPYCLLERHP